MLFQTYCTIRLAQLVLAKELGLALKVKPILRVFPIAAWSARLDLKEGWVLISACTSSSMLYRNEICYFD